MKVYIIGPMTGYHNFNFAAFKRAAKALRALGHEVVSPAEHDLEIGFDPTLNTLDGFDLSAAMRWDLEQVQQCEVVAVLPGWSTSPGACAELSVAAWCHLPVWVLGVDGKILRKYDRVSVICTIKEKSFDD